MMQQTLRIIERVRAENPSMKQVTSIQIGRIALEFTKMHENPDEFLLHNRYCEQRP